MDQPQELIQLSDSDSDDSDSSDSDSGSDSDSDSDSDDSAQSTTSYEEVVESKAGIDQALRFFNSVKDAFGGNSEVFAKFKQLLKDYRNDINVVQSKIKLLFKDHPEFVAGFNTFLPAGFDISMPVQTDHSVSFAVDIEEAIRFVNKVKVEYMHDERRYASFLNILKGHASKEKSIVEVFEEVRAPFHDRPDLVLELFRFLPDLSNSTTTEAATQQEPNGRSKETKKSCILFSSTVSFLALSILVVFGLGISLGFYLAES